MTVVAIGSPLKMCWNSRARRPVTVGLPSSGWKWTVRGVGGKSLYLPLSCRVGPVTMDNSRLQGNRFWSWLACHGVPAFTGCSLTGFNGTRAATTVRATTLSGADQYSAPAPETGRADAISQTRSTASATTGVRSKWQASGGYHSLRAGTFLNSGAISYAFSNSTRDSVSFPS